MDAEKGRINQAEIARALGISQSTVSIALKGDTRVAKKTRDAIRKKADEMGYVPDPNLTALSLYRRRTKSEKVVAAMAWVTNHPTEDGWKTKMCSAHRKGIKQQALKLGYQIYDFWMGDPKISSDRMRQILVARGIRGLIFAPQAQYHTKIDFDFSQFAAVSLGYSLQSPALHRVTNYQHHTVRLAYRSLQKLGYERIGMMLNNAVDRRVDRNFSGGYHSLNPAGLSGDFVQPHLYADFQEDAFEAWYKQWTPDAIIVTGDSQEYLKEWMRKKGMKIGSDISYAELNLNSTEGNIAGVDQQPELIGKATANVLDSLLSHFEYGLPSEPLCTMVEGVWRDGESAPKKC